MKFENTTTAGFEPAFRGMRNPMNSWAKSDSSYCSEECDDCERAGFCEGSAQMMYCKPTEQGLFILGREDLKLAYKLIRGGREHRKFLRQIQVWVDITAPLYWWKEFDTYKVGVTANSTSTMHKLASTPITRDCFEISDSSDSIGDNIIDNLEHFRRSYNATGNKSMWRALIQWLPESWLQTRTVNMNYENVRNMIHQRKNHKLTEWSVDFINWAKSLPYSGELLFYNGEEGET